MSLHHLTGRGPELLRAVAAASQNERSVAVFKGGTSLSKGFGLIERFSEDVDILLVPPDGLGANARHGILKRIELAAASHLGLAETDVTLVQSTNGIKRDVRYPYRRRFDLGILSEGLLLEIGVRGGPEPRASMTIDSYLARYAKEVLDLPVVEFDEFHPVRIDVLATERTLVEKLALLHSLASRYPERGAMEKLEKSGRHYYDIYRLLGDVATRTQFVVRGSVEDLATDIDRKSAQYEWAFTPRPEAGYGHSPAFEPDHGSQSYARRGFDRAAQLIYGERPAFDDCVQRVRDSADLL